MIPHIEAVVLAHHVHVAGHRRGVTQANRDDDAALRVELGGLSEVVHAIQIAQPRWMRRRHRAELLFDLEPDRQRIDADVLASKTCQEQFAAVLALEQSAKSIGDLESPFVIDASRRVAPKHTKPLLSLHFFPQNSTQMLRDPPRHVNRKI